MNELQLKYLIFIIILEAKKNEIEKTTLHFAGIQYSGTSWPCKAEKLIMTYAAFFDQGKLTEGNIYTPQVRYGQDVYMHLAKFY